MSTRAIAEVYDEDGQILVQIYKHWDGYPEGFGSTLENICGRFTIINGIGRETVDFANGMGCFAAQLIKELKKEIGDVYITNTTGIGEEYLYKIFPENGEVKVTWEQV